jgi:hypothetical protein
VLPGGRFQAELGNEMQFTLSLFSATSASPKAQPLLAALRRTPQTTGERSRLGACRIGAAINLAPILQFAASTQGITLDCTIGGFVGKKITTFHCAASTVIRGATAILHHIEPAVTTCAVVIQGKSAVTVLPARQTSAFNIAGRPEAGTPIPQEPNSEKGSDHSRELCRTFHNCLLSEDLVSVPLSISKTSVLPEMDCVLMFLFATTISLRAQIARLSQ